MRQLLPHILFAVHVMVAVVSPAQAGSSGSQTVDHPDTLTFVYVQKAALPKTQWLIKIYTEALKRMDITFKFIEVPAKRASVYSNSGEVDGELNRVSTYGRTFTNMVIVPEANLQGSFSAFTTDPTLYLKGWKSLEGTVYRVGLLRGVVYSDKNLSRVLPPEQLFPVGTTVQGIRMLMEKRTDLYVSNTAATQTFLKSHEGQTLLASLPQHQKVHNAGIMGVTRGHAWLHKSHASLTKPLARILRKMKEEGLYEKYSQQTGFYPEAVPMD